MRVQFSYLESKLAHVLDEGHEVLENSRALMRSGDFTLGKEVRVFEESIEKMLGVKHAIGVANGTDALRISLRMAGVRPGDEVITAANTFVASAGCIDELFATPKFVDMGPNYVMDHTLLEAAITPRTKAIVPVHFTGEPCEMDAIMEIANEHKIPVIEDACQALMAEYRGRYCGTIGLAGAISLHPLKVLNGTGDGGLILTNDDEFAHKTRLYRNHGLVGRNNVASFGCNSRLDTAQAVYLNYLLNGTPIALTCRQINADLYDEGLSKIIGVNIIKRRPYARSCFHLYFIEVNKAYRDYLVDFLNKNEIEAKVHYPVPLQGVLELCDYNRKDFPMAYRQSDRIVTLPVHEHLTTAQLGFVIEKIEEFMREHI